MKLSVIIPVYNVEKYLQDCIDSLIRQSVEDCEYIFVDDASTDSCRDILFKNEKKYPNKIRVIASDENRYQGGARNIGIRSARGGYIGFVDSDDLCLPNMFKDMLNRAADTDAVFIKYAAVNDDYKYNENDTFEGKELIKWNAQLLKCGGKDLSDNDRMNLIAYPVGGVYCGIWKKEIIIKNDIFFPEKLKYEDNYWETIIKLYLKHVTFIDEVGYLYRTSPSSTTHQKNAMHHCYDRIQIERGLVAEVNKRGFYETYKEGLDYIFITRYIFTTFGLVLNQFENPPKDILIELIKELRAKHPQYQKNRYYMENRTFKQKIKDRFSFCFPSTAIAIYKMLHK